MNDYSYSKSSSSSMSDVEVKEAAVNLVLQSQTDYKIMAEMMRRVERMMQNSSTNSELFRYKLAELRRSIEQVKVHL
jgi:hypothetical protein